MSQLRMVFSTIAFYCECCKSGRKRGEREWKATLNQGESPHSLTLVMYVPVVCAVCKLTEALFS